MRELAAVLAAFPSVSARMICGAATSDLLGGNIHLSSITIQAVIPHMKAGRLKVLGIGGTTRSPLLPDVPTVAESGLPDYNTTGWRGLVGPAGLPAPLIRRLTREVRAILESEEVRTHFQVNGMEVDYRDPSAFASYIAEDLQRWQQVVRKADIRL